MIQLRQQERNKRASETPIVGSLPEYPGILAAIMISPELAKALRELANELLVRSFPGSTLTRGERELIATAVSAKNDCFFCMDSHGAFASALLRNDGVDPEIVDTLVADLKCGRHDGFNAKMRAVIQIALTVREDPLCLEARSVKAATDLGATDQDVQLAVLIASAFCMYNRMVDGFRARTPSDPAAHDARGQQIVEFGYSDSSPTALQTAA